MQQRFLRARIESVGKKLDGKGGKAKTSRPDFTRESPEWGAWGGGPTDAGFTSSACPAAEGGEAVRVCHAVTRAEQFTAGGGS